MLEAPVECPTEMSAVERYHGPLRLAYHRLVGCEQNRDAALQHALFAVNSTIRPEGLVPILLVYGLIPRPARNAPGPFQLARTRAIEGARAEIVKWHAKAKLKVGLSYKGPFAGERADLDTLREGDQVQVYRPHKKDWQIFRWVSREGETCTVQDARGRRCFRSNVVRPIAHADSSRSESEHVSSACMYALFGEHDADQGMLGQPGVDEWRESRIAELRGLEEGKVLKVVPRSVVRPGERIYGTRFVDTIKAGGVRKSRLVARNFRDATATSIPTRSPTISRAAQRLAFSFAASEVRKGSKVFLRDVTQAYTQSDAAHGLTRNVFLEPPAEMGLDDTFVLQAVQPLYGVPEAGLCWFLTYSEHHRNRLQMVQSRGDKCLFIREDGDRRNIIILQVDDSWGVGTRAFLEEEEHAATKFRTKPRTIFNVGSSERFNGLRVHMTGEGISIEQQEKLAALRQPKTPDQLVSTRAAMQYVGTCTRPDLSAPTQMLASLVDTPTASTYRTMSDLVCVGHSTSAEALHFVPLDEDSLRVVVVTDAAFANAEGFRSQLGFVILLVDKYNCANIVHYGSLRSPRVTRSVMAAELIALVVGFDHAFWVRKMVSEILGRRAEIMAAVDSKTVFDTVMRLSSTLEKRLQIDAYALHEAHRVGDLAELTWIERRFNVADPLTHAKYETDNALRALMRTNQLDLPATGSCYRLGRNGVEHQNPKWLSSA